MKMYKCPHCAEKTISIIDKATMNIKYRSKCKACGMCYGPPYGYSALLLLIICVIFGITYISGLGYALKIVIFLGLIATYHAVNIFVIPIEKKQSV